MDEYGNSVRVVIWLSLEQEVDERIPFRSTTWFYTHGATHIMYLCIGAHYIHFLADNSQLLDYVYRILKIIVPSPFKISGPSAVIKILLVPMSINEHQ
jgi:hypothetical protein